jgi:competence ComEA-like helix-hairpin-helix protein
MKDSFQKGLPRYERNGIILLCIFILTGIAAQRYVLQYFKSDHGLSAVDSLKIVQLKQQINAANEMVTYPADQRQEPGYSTRNYSAKMVTKPEKYDFKIEVNSATAADYEKLYGIGKVLSERIIKFRDKLGGFYSLEQIKDVYGIQDSTFKNFRKNLFIKPVKIKKININTASYEELTANPYFFSTLAKQVIGYRTKVKPFSAPDDVRNLYYIRDHPEIFEKIAVYITVN